DGLDAGLARLDRRAEVDRPAFQPDLAFVRRDGAGDRLDHRGFSGPVVADNGKNLARIEIEVGVVEGGDAAVALDETPSCENGFLSHQPATFLIHWSIATAVMMRTPIK